MPDVQTLDEVFNEMQQRFKSEKASGMDASFQFDISGDEGGLWNAVIKDGACVIEKGELESPTVTISASADNWVSIVNGSLNPQMAFMTGKIKVKGDIGLATKLGTLFL